jgi:hypothetical protein
MMKKSLLAALLGLSVLCFASSALAVSDSHKQGEVTQSDNALDGPALGAMLTSLGYETGTTAPGQFAIEMKQGIYKFHPSISLSSSGNKIWITEAIRVLTPADAINSELLLNLLKANSAIGPAQFYVDNVAAAGKAADWRLSYGYPIDNRGVSSTVLRAALDSFATSLEEQATIWDPAAAKK